MTNRSQPIPFASTPERVAVGSAADVEAFVREAKMAQALAILEALDGIVIKFNAVHIVRDQNGVVIVRVEDTADDASIDRAIPEQYRGASVRDALAQAAQVVS